MSKITKHIPGCVDISGEPPTVEFNNTEELLSIDFVKSFSEDYKRGDGSMRRFFRYSLSDDVLLAEYDNGLVWWGVGHIDDTRCVKLPIPEYQKNRKQPDCILVQLNGKDLGTIFCASFCKKDYVQDMAIRKFELHNIEINDVIFIPHESIEILTHEEN